MRRPRIEVDQEKVVSKLKDIGEKVRQEATEFSSLMRSEASRTWKISNLKLEIGLLGRRRRKRLADLGELAYGLMRDGALEPSSLASLYGEVEDMDAEIAEKESRVVALEQGARQEREDRKGRRKAAKASRAVDAEVVADETPVEKEPTPRVARKVRAKPRRKTTPRTRARKTSE